MKRLRGHWLIVYVGFCSCAGGAAGSRVNGDIHRGDYRAALAFYESEGHSSQVLRALSEGILLQAARSSDSAQRRSAFIELSMLGTRAEALLEQLSQPAEPVQVRAEALRLRTQLGDTSAREDLRALLDHPDPDVSDSAIQALEPGPDRALLEAALRSPRTGRRGTALALLGRGNEPQRVLLTEASRFDPSPQLRIAALRALERFGAASADALERALQDADSQVSAAALEALAQVAPERAEPILDRQLGAAVSSQSISAALALLGMTPVRQKARAQAALLAALQSPDGALRAQAATALQRLPRDRIDLGMVRSCLRVEKSDAVRLALSLRLGLDDSAARQTFSELSESFTLTGAEAAAELAAHSGSARKRLFAFSAHESATVRITAARLIARTLRDPAPVAKLLADTNWQVREAAAGAVLNVM